MKKLVLIIGMVAMCTPSGAGAEKYAPSTLERIAALSYAEASRHMPVYVTATVTYYRGYENLLFIQDGEVAIYVHATTDVKLKPGDRVLVRGRTHESFRSYIESSEITVLGHGAMPAAAEATYAEMIRGEKDCRLVRVRALIRAADVMPSSIFLVRDIYLQMLVDGEQVDAHLDSQDEGRLKDLLDAEVEITGVASGQFDNKMQQTGVLLHIQSLEDVRLLKGSGEDPWSLAETPMDRVITGYAMRDQTERLRVHGSITYYEPGEGLVLQDGAKSLWVMAKSYRALRVGDLAEATGFPDVQDGFLTLTRSEVRDAGAQAPVAPAVSTWRDLATGGNNAHSRIFDLVSLEGQVVAEVRQATQDEYVLSADGHLVSAIFRHPGSLSRISVPAMKEVPVGARVRVTGICMLANADPFYGEVPFNIVLRSFDDVKVVARPPWLNVRHLMLLVGLLLAAVFGVGARGWKIERKMRHQTALQAAIEQRRSSVLEQMNASRPLGEILSAITELVSFQMRGAWCWCELTDGTQAGVRPEGSAKCVESYPITAAFGPALGTMFVACREPGVGCHDALARASGLIALAIETSRLHADLVRRSEFDQLTDIHNRFSLEQSLDRLIDAARHAGTIFGLIYIDLNEFKGINDRCGHRTGDLYLKRVAARIVRQLRPGDTLARLGGDEFAVLAPQVRNRGEAEEIARRVDNCFVDPFAVEGNAIYGSASIGVALYPEDATTKDGLLNVADAAMYGVKRMRQGVGKTGEPAAEAVVAAGWEASEAEIPVG